MAHSVYTSGLNKAGLDVRLYISVHPQKKFWFNWNLASCR